MPTSRSTTPRLLVTLVSRHASTLEALEKYLKGAGVESTTTGTLERVVEMTPPSAAAVILFPDEYPTDATRRALAALTKSRPDVLTVIVTHEPGRFARPATEDARGTSPLVMPKPAWAWTILDAVRARLDERREGTGRSML